MRERQRRECEGDPGDERAGDKAATKLDSR
jgi:hypothetical protein